MEYPPVNVTSGQQNYSQPQEQNSVSPGCNIQSTGSTFPGSESGSHNRSYPQYPQPYQPSHEYSSSQGPHPSSNNPNYPHYPAEGHGQSLTLNQLLQQGNTPGNYQLRPQGAPTGQAPYHPYDSFPYGYKPGLPGNAPDRSQASSYPYGNPPGHRYMDPYSRPAYPGYPPGPGYQYYQGSLPSSSPQQRQQGGSLPNSDYLTPGPATTSPRPTTPVTVAPSGDRLSSTNTVPHGHATSITSVSHLSSPLHTNMSANPPTSNWSPHTLPFGSPSQLNHGQSHQSRPRSTSRDSHPSKCFPDSSADSQMVVQCDRSSEANQIDQMDEADSSIHSRAIESAKPPITGAACLGGRESSDEQMAHNSADSQLNCSMESSGNPVGSLESCSPTRVSNYPNNSTASPIHIPRGTPPQPSTSYPQILPPTSPVVSQPGLPSFSQPSPSPPAQKLSTQSSQPFRSFVLSPQGHPMSRMPYPPCSQGVPQQQPTIQPSGQYMTGGRPPLYPGGCSPIRSVTSSPSSNLPRPGGPIPNFQAQSGNLGVMPPPAPPPPTANPPLPGSHVSTSQMGSLNVSSYISSSAPSGPVYGTAPWESQPHASGTPNNVAQQPFVPGRTSAIYTGPPDRGTGYSSPQPMGTGAPGGPAGSHTQTPMPAGVYHHPPVPSSHHSQMPSYQASQSPYHPHPYMAAVVPGTQPPVPSQPGQPTSMSNTTTTISSYPQHPLSVSGSSGQPSREHFYAQYNHISAQNMERGPPQFFGSMGPETSAFSGNSPIAACRTGMTSIPKGPPVATSAKGPKGLCSGVGASEDDSMTTQQQLPTCATPNHPNQPPVHNFPGGYWPEGVLPHQYNSSSVSPQPFPAFPQQTPQQHYRPPMPSQMHPHYVHGLPNSVCGPSPGGSIYGGGAAPHNCGHLHSVTPGISAQSSNGFQKLLEMGSEPERRGWLEHYVRFMEDIGKPLVGLPQVVKQPLDLYRFYLAVRERGGVLEVIKARRWKEISQLVNINASASAAYTLRKNYCKFLLDYECRFDRGGTDPRPILLHIEAMSGKKKKLSPGDSESGCGVNSSLSSSGLQLPAPPSPTGSHSSASSSLLPPGSGSASLSGVPTAGSGASDLGSAQQPQRFSDSGQPNSNTPLELANGGLSNSPTSSALSSGASVMPGTNVSSPQRPGSATSALNGYGNVSQNLLDSAPRSTVTWPWSSDACGVVSSTNTQNSPQVTVNGFSAAPSPIRGPLATYSGQGSFDSNTRPQSTESLTAPTKSSPYQTPFGTGPGSFPSSVAQVTTTSVSSTASLPSSSSLNTSSPSVTTVAAKGVEPTVHHHAGVYPGQPSAPCSAVSQSHHLPQQHPISPGHPAMQHTGLSGPMHPRLCVPLGVRPSPFTSATVGPPNTAASSDPVALLCMQQLRSSNPAQLNTNAYPPNAIPPFPGAVGPNVPAHLVHHHGQRSGYVATILKRVEHHAFPPGTVEATQIEPSRKRRIRAKDLGPIAPFKLLMGLRSGLTAEISWALNCLNILLRDESAVEFLNSNMLSSFITNLVELWRHSLGELFNHDVFVTDLELPADFSEWHRAHRDDKRDFPPPEAHTRQRSPVATKFHPHGLHSKKPSSMLISSNDLTDLERDITTLATLHNLSLSSVRRGIKQSLRKSDSNTHSYLHRVRNGLLLRADQLSVTSASTTNSTNTPGSADLSGLPNARTRKRGKLPSAGFPYASSTSTVSPTSSISCSSSVVSQTSNAVVNTPLPLVAWTATRVTVNSNCFRSPEAYSNLRELALFVIDDLLSNNSQSLLLPSDPEFRSSKSDVKFKHKSLLKKGKNRSHCKKRRVHCLRDIILHGGGDTTCHIMPPFGSLPFFSKHWCGDLDKARNYSIAGRPGCLSSTPPPVVLNEKCHIRNEFGCEPDDQLESTDDLPPSSKRIRHVSTSSLSCPVLSPQQIDEPPGVDTLGSTTRIPFDSATHQKQESVTKVDHAEDGDEFSQLVMDSNGRCPLRAREELVHYGATCLWPDNSDTDSNEARAVRCLCVSTVLRNLSFMNFAEHQLSIHKGVLSLIGRVILLGHNHVIEFDTWQTVESAALAMEASFCAWRTPTWLEDMRENALVLLVNVAGYLNLIEFEESIVRPILTGLLHWITCSTAVAIDPFPGHRTLSPRRLALEAVNRLFVHQSNVDLLLATPNPQDSDLSKLFDRLANWLALSEDQVTRELALSTMHYLTGGGLSFTNVTDSMSAKVLTGDNSTFSVPSHYIGTTMLACAKPCPISGLLSFIEAAETTTRRVIEQYGVQALQERPDLMGTSLEMVRRAGALLDRLAADPIGRRRFTPNLELRLMDLVTSRVLDATVAHLLCGALHRLSPDFPSTDQVIAPLVPHCPSPANVAQLIQHCKTVVGQSATERQQSSVESVKAIRTVKETSSNEEARRNDLMEDSSRPASETMIPGPFSRDSEVTDDSVISISEDAPELTVKSVPSHILSVPANQTSIEIRTNNIEHLVNDSAVAKLPILEASKISNCVDS